MRKYLAVLLGVLLILSFAVTAFAEDKTDITLGGKILVRGWYFDDVSADALPTETDTNAMYSTNVFLTLDAKVADNVRGFIELETGTSNTSGLYYWGKSSSNDSKADGHMYFRQAWINYSGSGLLGVPAGVKIGHQFLSLGEKQFFNHERFGDDAILLTVEPTKELLLGLLTIKVAEGETGQDGDDLDANVLLGIYKINKDNTVGLNYTHVNNSDGDLSLQNLGLHANGDIAGLKYAASVDYQFGGQNDDVDFNAYGILAKVGYQLDPVNLRASFALGSGDDDNSATDDKNKEFQALVGNDNQSATARQTHYTQIYERTIQTAAAYNILGNTRTTGIANTTYFNLGADINPVKELGISLDGYILRATETGGWEDDLGHNVSKNIGWEIDSKISYKLAKNLTYFIEAGLFKAGGFYDDAYGLTDKKTVKQAVHGLSLTF